MAKIEGLSELKRKLNKFLVKAKKEFTTSVTVGYTQTYAVIVHEAPRNYRVGQAQYLYGPAQRMRKELGNIALEVLKQTGSLKQALLVAGLRLQREAQELTPVDTGALKASAFTAPTTEAPEAAARAFARSERLRKSVLRTRAQGRRRTAQENKILGINPRRGRRK